LAEQRGIAQRLEHPSKLNHLCDVDDALNAVVKFDTETIVAKRFDRNHVSQDRSLLQRRNAVQRLLLSRKIPIFHQFHLIAYRTGVVTTIASWLSPCIIGQLTRWKR
jgi:hypothetical protein